MRSYTLLAQRASHYRYSQTNITRCCRQRVNASFLLIGNIRYRLDFDVKPINSIYLFVDFYLFNDLDRFVSKIIGFDRFKSSGFLNMVGFFYL